jgi:3'-phosphoadenosine 5'-phosphosulfate sulfotransferase (PAPS reductase)/FAD synthetase
LTEILTARRTPQHFVGISGGKDSLATALLAKERMQHRPDFRPRYQFVDVGNENQVTLDHVDYLERMLESPIERLTAYDVPGLCDADAFARKRESIRKHWPVELRRKRHSSDCADRKANIPELAAGCRHSPERRDAVKAWAAACDCPTIISPPVSQERIEVAVAALQPTGNAFLDVCLIHGRFPSRKAKFCTEDLKLAPLFATRNALLNVGTSTVDWVGERAAESKARAKKPILERRREASGASRVVYRPIHGWSAAEVFAIAKRHGIRPNPLYLLGASRVGCWPCINSQKAEIALVAKHSPEKIDWLREAERLVSLVSRRDAGGGSYSTFFSADKVPGEDDERAMIDKVVEWTKTSRGGLQFDMIQALERNDAPECFSQYGLCE